MEYDDGETDTDLDLAIEDFEWLKETKKKRLHHSRPKDEESVKSEEDSDSGSEYSESDDSDSEYENGVGKRKGEEKGPVCVNHEAKGVKKQRAIDAVRAFLKMNWEKITLHMHMKEHEVRQQKEEGETKKPKKKKVKKIQRHDKEERRC